MYVNGFVIQKYADNSYKGIDGSGFSDSTGENWYFNNDEKLSKEFEPFCDENINKTYYNTDEYSYVSVCTDMKYIVKYIEESKKQNIKYRLLLCETEIQNPVMKLPEIEMKFLGYDYAYSIGDNYSAVYNEIPYVFQQFKLNENGLFQTEKEIREYIIERERYKSTHSPYTLEEGEFTIFKLHEVFL